MNGKVLPKEVAPSDRAGLYSEGCISYSKGEFVSSEGMSIR